MLTAMRREAIKTLLSEKKSVKVLELAQAFSVTGETIRRDLSALEKEGFLTKVRGGAFIQGGTLNEIDIHLRSSAFTRPKKDIAIKCLEIIQNGDSIFLDSSTTACKIAELLKDFRITVLTNSFKVCEVLSSCDNINLISIGGTFDKKYLAFFGPNANRAMTSYHVDKAFFSCRSANMKFGVMDSNEKTAEFRQLLIRQSFQSYLCIDSSKFDKTSFNNICEFSDLYAIVTNQKPSEEWCDFLNNQQIRLIIANQSSSID